MVLYLGFGVAGVHFAYELLFWGFNDVVYGVVGGDGLCA